MALNMAQEIANVNWQHYDMNTQIPSLLGALTLVLLIQTSVDYPRYDTCTRLYTPVQTQVRQHQLISIPPDYYLTSGHPS